MKAGSSTPAEWTQYLGNGTISSFMWPQDEDYTYLLED